VGQHGQKLGLLLTLLLFSCGTTFGAFPCGLCRGELSFALAHPANHDEQHGQARHQAVNEKAIEHQKLACVSPRIGNTEVMNPRKMALYSRIMARRDKVSRFPGASVSVLGVVL
jgi:hypothetical protein